MFSKLSFQKINNTLPLTQSLTLKSKQFYRLRLPRPKPSAYDIERANYKKILHQYRLKNIKEYWERQTQVENSYIGMKRDLPLLF